MSNIPKLGAESFWEMTALTMAGGLASCRSCVEHFYYQSFWSASAFLDACVFGRLLERVSLLDLYGDVGSRAKPSVRQTWYDEPIYISAPRFRKTHLDAARQRLESTKQAVMDALRLYHEVLGGNDDAIDAAYSNSIERAMLRHSDIAYQRRSVALSPIAKLRLIQDGFRKASRRENPTSRREEIEALVTSRTAAYVKEFFDKDSVSLPLCDYIEELEEYVEEFFRDRHALEEYWKSSYGEMPADYRLQWLPVMFDLVRRCYTKHLQKSEHGRAKEFVDGIIARAQEAQQHSPESKYKTRLPEFQNDLKSLLLGVQERAA